MPTITSIDQLVAPDSFRVYVEGLAHRLGCSEGRILDAVIATLMFEQKRRSDDIAEVLLLGRVLRVALGRAARLHGQP
jgi:hypothetical protein